MAWGPPTFTRAGQDVLNSARGHSSPSGGAGGGCAGLAFPGGAPVTSPAGCKPASPEIPGVEARRRVAIKKAFKRLDPLGSGVAHWEDVKQTLAQSASGQQKLVSELEQLTEKLPDGKLVLSYSSFLSYYIAVSKGMALDTEFEQILHSEWGYADVSDILKSMQRQFASIGLRQVFQDCPAGEVSLAQFESSMRRGGLQPRRDDMQRLGRAFVGRNGGVMLDEFKDQMLAPRPETPAPVSTRDLVLPSSPGAPAAPASIGAPSAAAAAGPPPSDGDLDAMLNRMEGHLHGLRNQQTAGAGPAAPASPGDSRERVASAGLVPGAATAGVIPGSPPGGGGGAGAVGIVPGSPQGGGGGGAAAPAPHRAKLQHHEVPDGPVSDQDLDSMLSKMQGHLNHLKASKVAAEGGGGAGPGGPSGGGGQPEGPISDADLDAALSHMEGHIKKVRQHKRPEPGTAQPHWDNSAPVEDPPDMPHWEHHKYGHHKITAPAWKPQANVTDMYGHQHVAAEYGYSNYGAGAHGHHLSHYHLNDYHGLAHHSFSQQEYGKKTFGDAAHHGHWVPHLHGIGTAKHHGEHSYGKDEYKNKSYGDAGHHGHWVPHLHGLGGQHRPKP